MAWHHVLGLKCLILFKPNLPCLSSRRFALFSRPPSFASSSNPLLSEAAPHGQPPPSLVTPWSHFSLSLPSLTLSHPTTLYLTIDVLKFRFQRGLKRKPLALVKKLRKAKMEAAAGVTPFMP
jgi:hypothetical protein